MKICLGIPSYKTIHPRTLNSLLRLVEASEHDFIFSVRNHHSIAHNRNKIVEEAEGSDYILFVDADMTFGEGTLKRLLAQNKDIIGVDYSYKELPRQTTVKHDFKETPKELFSCRAVGGGILLVKTSVFKKIAKPYFVMDHNEEGYIAKGEDVYFCEKAREAGFEIYCDPTLIIGHVGDYTY